MIVIVYTAVVAMSGGLILGVYLGARAWPRAERRRPPVAHEVLAAEAIVLGLRGPLPARKRGQA